MSEQIHINQGILVGVRTSIFTIFNPEKYDKNAIPEAWQKFFSMAAGTKLVETDTYYGASIPSMSMDLPMDYFAGALVDVNFKVPKGFESVTIPEGNYLKVLHKGPISDLAATYQKAYMQELAASGKEMRPAPHLEIYNSQKDPMAADYEMIIGVPII
jgi:predicted transcriptional regulator YdeE